MQRCLVASILLVVFSAIDPSAIRAADDFGKLLPRVPGKSPADSLAAMETVPGFHVELVAGEPLVRDPVAVDFDESGRMYVVQLPPYNLYVTDQTDVRGSIVLLEDTDGDGHFDKSTPFAEDLIYPTAVACWEGGIYVGDAPDLLYMKDTDGDGKADKRQVVMTGFGRDKAGEGQLNSIRWGLDNRFHFSAGLDGGDVTPGGVEGAKGVSVRGRGVIFDPREPEKFQLTSGDGQFGMSMDDWGRKFVCSNSVPAQTLMYDDRYVARNPQLQAPAAAINITPPAKGSYLFRVSPPEPWRVLRTKLRSEGKFRGSDEGGVPFGFFTGATGVTIYRGDAWPAEYRGDLLVGDVANNLVHRAKVREDGLALLATRADEGKEFLASKDIWFRPVQFANAPDGTLYVLDMYRELIEGAAFLPPEFLEHIDVASGNDQGRIYRIAPNDFANRRTSFRLDRASTAELVSLLEHANGWHRDTASRLLFQRQDSSAVAALEVLAAKSTFAQGRVHALYCLDGLGALKEQTVLAALDDAEPSVRIHALRLAEKFASSVLVRARLVKAANDPSLNVRYQLAFSLGSFHDNQSSATLAKLAMTDSADKWMRMAIGSSLDRGAETVFRTLASKPDFASTPHGRELLVTLARQIGGNGRANEIAVLLGTLEALSKADKSLGEAIVQAMIDKQSGAAREQILAAAGGKASAILAKLLEEAKSTAIDDGAELAARSEAIASLRLAPFAETKPLLDTLLQPIQPQPVQAAALETAALFEEPAVAELVLRAWPGLSPKLRTSAAETLLSRPTWIALLLDAVEKGTVARGDIDPARVQLLAAHPDKKIADRVNKLFANVQLSARKEVVDGYQQALQLEGNPDKGKEIFKKNCSGCHRLDGVGDQIGAELKGIRQRGLPAVLLNILDPNREVKPEFLTYIVQTVDGRLLTGMISAETANSITIRRADATSVTVQRFDIEQMRGSGLSFMPEGLEKDIDLPAMADLLSYLNTVE